ncbi:TetR/AcrR family transcriptional regulator [Microbacterium sp. NIBRBAC000506063]|uniref:TetR/AcrR family transcriptional regulator n=1 Tax=Microbacterium sp. NIBRBAC000506063 TaxID=2734618 RepID=UPI001BB7846A|nr:TetR family transcriptional regulator [Microbacterium sp. NIBRBAC000506063]QTV79976.1 TetR family transcriptional regulator [Microbacterium sp. NIBRBAC000506063]
MPEETVEEAPRRAERKDRARNRERLIEAARTVFAASGIHAPLDHIATAAGVGSGTLYRHFPTRAMLWTAVLREPLQRHLALVEKSLADPDPWEGFAAFIYGTCEIDAQRGAMQSS